jgi:hypothetical protein
MPAPAPTELLAEDIRDLRESNHRIAARVDSLERAVRDIGTFRVDFGGQIGGFRGELAYQVGRFRAEVMEKLNAINTNLEKFEARIEASLRFAVWATTILTPVVIGLIGGALWITWHAAKLDSRVERVESRLGKEPVATPAAGVH